MSTHDNVLSDRVARIETCLQAELGFGGHSNGRVGKWQTRYAERLQRLDSEVCGGEGLSLKTRLLILWHSYVWIIGLAGMIAGILLEKMLGK